MSDGALQPSRRRRIAVAIAVVLLTAAAVTLLTRDGGEHPTAPRPVAAPTVPRPVGATRVVTVPWTAKASGPRTLVVRFILPLCHVGEARVRVHESQRAIRIAVAQRVAVSSGHGSQAACTTEAIAARRTVRLAAPIAGRPIERLR